MRGHVIEEVEQFILEKSSEAVRRQVVILGYKKIVFNPTIAPKLKNKNKW